MRESPAECGRVGNYVVRKKAGRAGTIFGKLWAPVIRANVRSQYCARPAESSNVNYLMLTLLTAQFKWAQTRHCGQKSKLKAEYCRKSLFHIRYQLKKKTRN